MAKLSTSRQKALLRKYSRNVKFFMMLLSIGLIVFFLPKQAKFSYEYEKGRIWNQKDLASPYNFAILKTQQEIKNDQKTAKESITPIYQLDAAVENQQLEGFKSDIEIKWHNAGISDRLKPKYISTGTDLLQEIYETGVLKLNPQYQVNSENYPITVLNKNVATAKNTNELFTKEKALAYCDKILSKHTDLDKAFLLDMLQNRLQTNLNYDNNL